MRLGAEDHSTYLSIWKRTTTAKHCLASYANVLAYQDHFKNQDVRGKYICVLTMPAYGTVRTDDQMTQ